MVSFVECLFFAFLVSLQDIKKRVRLFTTRNHKDTTMYHKDTTRNHKDTTMYHKKPQGYHNVPQGYHKESVFLPQGYSRDTKRNNEVSQGYPVANDTYRRNPWSIYSTMSVQHTSRNPWNTWKCLYKVLQGPIPGTLLTMSIYCTQGIPGALRHVYRGSPMACDVI
jgi:hypothetical protein